ncbi:MAG: hypothetical protein ABI599_17965 [Flavobacteriales bacterium]
MKNDRLAQLLEMLAEEPGDVFLRYAIALEHKRIGRTEQAIGELEELVRDIPAHIATYYQLALLLAEIGRTADARNTCEAGMLQCLVIGDRKARGELSELRNTLVDEQE